MLCYYKLHVNKGRGKNSRFPEHRWVASSMINAFHLTTFFQLGVYVLEARETLRKRVRLRGKKYDRVAGERKEVRLEGENYDRSESRDTSTTERRKVRLRGKMYD